MTTNTKNSAEITQQIENQENELKDLLSRVIKNPLKPLESQITQLEKRLESVEAISKSTSEVNLPAVQAAIRTQGEDAQKNFKGLRKAITEELPELLTACLAFMPQEVARLHKSQTSVKDLLGEVRQEQTLQGKLAGDTFLQSEMLLLKSLAQTNEINNLAKAAVQASEKAVTQIDESCGHIRKNLDSMQSDGRLGIQQLGNGITTLAGTTVELGSRLESGFTSFRKQSEKDRNELSSALQVMQKRFLWLSVLCGLSFVGTVGLVASRFVLHV